MIWRPVLTKTDFVRRYKQGEFGNASPTWDDLGSFLDSGYADLPDLVHIRNRVTGGPTWYDIPGHRVVAAWAEALQSGVRAENLYLSLMAPTAFTRLQGEVHQTYRGLELFYATVQHPMRRALLEAGRTERGIIAVSLLRQALCPNSYDWLQVLLDRYPEHVVEFSAYDHEWGNVPGFNTVFWEVRGGY